MPKYTSGELARLVGVSVRTVQYYDTRGILSPSELSEGGRRLYSDEDLGKMKIICFLRSLELPIDSIRSILEDDDSDKIIVMLLDKQEAELRREIEDKQEKVDKIADAKRALRHMPSVNASALSGIAHILENKSRLRRIRLKVFVIGFIMDIIQVTTLMIWILKGIWQPFAVGALAVVTLGVIASYCYFTGTAYICTECHTVFKPKLRQALFARHTPNTRKLTCTNCRHRGLAIETYGGKINAEN